jgi:hypothetical protein
MSRPEPPVSPEVRALLDEERPVPPLPATVRARALARARASLVAGPATASTSAASLSPARGTRVRWAAAVVLTCLGSAAVGAAAYQLHGRAETAPVRPVLVAAPAPAPAHLPAELPTVEPQPEPAPEATAPEGPRLSKAEAARAELKLLRQARAAVAREDFTAALRPIAEHTRRFKDGRLAEEREALRVKSLAGLGRTEEARRAAAAFKARFPRSVLLPAVSRMPANGP